MAKLTKKDKKEIRGAVRQWAKSVIQSTELPEEMYMKAYESSEDALAYMHQYKQTLADGLIILTSDA